MSLQTVPDFGIGQRAFLVRTAAGNILWDCVALLDQATEELIRAMGGLHAIAISHPHFYTTMQDWASAFDVPVYLHEANRDWVVRPDRRLEFWSGETLSIAPQATLVCVGGHFPGSTVLHWSGSADGAGAVLPGDAVQVAPGGRSVSFMWSFPNMLPLPSFEVARIAARLDRLTFDRLYGIFVGREVLRDARALVRASAARYRALLERSDGDCTKDFQPP